MCRGLLAGSLFELCCDQPTYTLCWGCFLFSFRSLENVNLVTGHQICLILAQSFVDKVVDIVLGCRVFMVFLGRCLSVKLAQLGLAQFWTKYQTNVICKDVTTHPELVENQYKYVTIQIG